MLYIHKDRKIDYDEAITEFTCNQERIQTFGVTVHFPYYLFLSLIASICTNSYESITDTPLVLYTINMFLGQQPHRTTLN